MPQVFPRVTNVVSRASILAFVLGVTALTFIWGAIFRSPYVTMANVVKPQPVPFSHRHHVSELGIDCRYCHTFVEETASAGIPPTSVCMNCHSQIHTKAPMLAPVRDSYKTGTPIEWTRVHDLPDFVYFNHSIHVAKGVACETCHGPVDKMPLMWQHATLQMDWCLNCHRHPGDDVRPPGHEFEFDHGRATWNEEKWTPAAKLDAQGIHPVKRSLTDCYVCHR